MVQTKIMDASHNRKIAILVEEDKHVLLKGLHCY